MATLKLSAALRARIDGRASFSPRLLPRGSTGAVRQTIPAEASEFEVDPGYFVDFETDERARKEDATRAERLAWVRPLDRLMSWTNMGPKLRLARQLVPHVRPPALDPHAIERFAAKLKAGVAGQPSDSLGSSVTMRSIRQTVLGALHTAFGDYPDEALATFTVINRSWTLTPQTLDAASAAKIKARFRADLNKIGITNMPGPFVAFLHGEFEPTSGSIVPHFHGTTTREKAEVLKRLKAKEGSRRFLGYVPTASGGAPVVCKPVRDRRKQFSYLLKSYWPARTIRWIGGKLKRDRQGRRIPEPFGSQVLLWLDRQRLRDLTIMNDCWSLRNGGTKAMKRLYLSVFGAW